MTGDGPVGAATTAKKLLERVEWAIQQGLPNRDVIAISRALIAQADKGSAEERTGRLRLAQALIPNEPWRAARLARELTRTSVSAEEWGTLGLALTRLGHFRAAASAYYHALTLDPACPMCCHNLGHLLDVALNRPADALRYLRRAHELLDHEPEVISSLAHAWFRTGRPEKAQQVLRNLSDADLASTLLQRWENAAHAAEH